MRRTQYLSVADIRELLAKVGLQNFHQLLVERLKSDFTRWTQFKKEPRTAHYSPIGVIELMPISDAEYFSFKYVSGHPRNRLLGVPTIMGFGCFSEVETGWPLLVSEMTVLTAVRTAATSALVAQALARHNSKTMSVIGNGAQSEFQVLAFHETLGIDRFRLYDLRPEATQRLIRNLANIKGLDLLPMSSKEEAVKGSDIVTTCTASKTVAAILVPEVVEPGMHLNAIGGDCPGKTELHPDVLKMGRVVVEFAGQARIEGDIQQMPPDFPVTELWEVLTGAKPGRKTDADVTIFDSVGFSLEDFSTLALTYDLANTHCIGRDLDLVPASGDVDDLYGLLNA